MGYSAPLPQPGATVTQMCKSYVYNWPIETVSIAESLQNHQYAVNHNLRNEMGRSGEGVEGKWAGERKGRSCEERRKAGDDTIRYDYFNVRSKADRCQLNLPHRTNN